MQERSSLDFDAGLVEDHSKRHHYKVPSAITDLGSNSYPQSVSATLEYEHSLLVAKRFKR